MGAENSPAGCRRNDSILYYTGRLDTVLLAKAKFLVPTSVVHIQVYEHC